MAFYAELLDTARILPEELRAAKTVLMLAALRPEPCELTSVHAFNSKLLLDECDDGAFYDLVIHGRIRFRWTAGEDGQLRSPRKEFCERLGVEPYFYYAWPEIVEPGGSERQAMRQDVCDLVRRIILGDPASTGISSLDSRVSTAKELFAAIEQSRYEKPELQRRTVFRKSLLAAVSDIPTTEEYHVLRSVSSELAANGEIDGRSRAWRAIESKQLSAEQEAQAKDVVDAAYSRSVAHSLQANLLSSRRLVPLGSSFHRAGKPRSARLRCFKAVEDNEHLKALISKPITWTAILEALSSQLLPLSTYGADNARTALAHKLSKQEWLVGTMPVVTAALGAAAGGLAPGAMAAVGLAGALPAWAAIPLAMLGAGGFVRFDKPAVNLLENHRAQQIKRDIDGWLDEI